MDLLGLALEVSEHDSSTTHIINQSCIFYYYCCDKTDDKGWGCGYRSLQSLCSWAVKRLSDKPSPDHTPLTVPNLTLIQETLVEIGDKPDSHIGSRDWIGTFEGCLVLDHLYGVPCKIIHVNSGGSVLDHVSELCEHFVNVGSPVMIGGDIDGASKTLLGVRNVSGESYFLIADPHYIGPPDKDRVIADGFLKWHGQELFQSSSFYNLCLPQNSS